MELPKGFHREVIEARENTNTDAIDFTDDSIKKRVSVSPLKSGGSNFKTHVLREISPSKLVYKPSIGGVLFSFLFFTIGFGFIFFNLVPLFKTGASVSDLNWVLMLFGGVFALAGSILFYNLYKPRVFDKTSGLYYKSYKESSFGKHHVSLETIIAIQIIGERISSDNGSYGSFELNLVLEDSSRLNVVDHGNLKSINNDAHVISEFLNIPIWHAKSAEKL
jgi:hypothetical protein